MNRQRIVISLAFLLFAFALILTTGRATVEPAIDGVVVDKAGKPIPGVTVTVYLQGKAIEPTTTGDRGNYSIRVDADKGPITSIEYYRSDYGLGSVAFVSAARKSTINKVLVNQNQTSSYAEMEAQIGALDLAYINARANNVPFEDFKRKYRPVIDALNKGGMVWAGGRWRIREGDAYELIEEEYNKMSPSDFEHKPIEKRPKN